MSREIVHHPIFARVFDRVLSRAIEDEIAARRGELLAGLSGRVVEVGAGNGINFAHYPATVAEVVATEPERYLRAKAEHAAARAPVTVTVGDSTASALPLESGSCDAAIASLVLCSLRDVAAGLAELRRVLRRGGELRFLEHVRSSDPGKARVQRMLDRSRIWPLLAGGCHCARDTVAAIEAAGFRIEQITSIDLGPSWINTNPFVLGIATAPDS
jgi:SAM-dependent methyltransferase